jgi:glycosyltransferase involved in cell wall biosynthesis
MNRVLIDCERMKYPHTGLYHFCLELGKALVDQSDSQMDLLTFYLPARTGPVFGPNAGYQPQKAFHRWTKVPVKERCLWHSTHQDSAYLPRSHRAKILLTVHDLNFLIERKDDSQHIRRKLSRLQSLVDRSEKVVCISNYTREVLLSHIDCGQKDPLVIYNGCNIPSVQGRLDPSDRPANPFLFSVGTVMPKKNFHVLPRLLENNDDFLLIAGSIDKNYSEVILREAETRGVRARVKLLGPVGEAAKNWYYQHCKAFVFPSLAEGFGLPVLEAMYFGKPIFLNNGTSLPEIGGDLAYYFNDFEPENMRQVLDNGLKNFALNQPSEKIRARAESFSWKTAAKNYLSLYREINHSNLT